MDITPHAATCSTLYVKSCTLMSGRVHQGCAGNIKRHECTVYMGHVRCCIHWVHRWGYAHTDGQILELGLPKFSPELWFEP